LNPVLQYRAACFPLILLFLKWSVDALHVFL
jgi:hypothetical protein